jgi:hypothetical protein
MFLPQFSGCWRSRKAATAAAVIAIHFVIEVTNLDASPGASAADIDILLDFSDIVANMARITFAVGALLIHNASKDTNLIP